jgi:hypothetical protein
MLNAIRRRAGAPASSGRYVVISALLLAFMVAPFAGASGEGKSVKGGKRNPSANKSAAYTAETQILTENGTYGTRQSNKKGGDGGGAIYGCRSAPGREPCIRANNLENGRAFEFQATSGTEGGFIEVGKGSPNTKAVPFNTNASARVANLNADRVDDLHAADIVAQAKDLWAVVAADGGLSRKNAATGSSKLGTGEYEVAFGSDVTTCAYNVTLGSTDTTEAPAGEAGASQRAGNAKAVAVVTRDSTGTKADRPFHLTVNC